MIEITHNNANARYKLQFTFCDDEHNNDSLLYMTCIRFMCQTIKSRELQHVSDAINRHFCVVFTPYGRRKFNEPSKSSLWHSEEILIGRKVSRICHTFVVWNFWNYTPTASG